LIFFQFPYFFFFCNFLIPPPCFLMTASNFYQSTCDLCCFHHYIFVCCQCYSAPPIRACSSTMLRVINVCMYVCMYVCYLHQDISTLLLLPYLSPSFGILHMSFHPWASNPYTNSWFKVLMPTFWCVKPHVHFEQFVLWYTFFIWNNLDITNLCFVLLLHNNIISCTFNSTSCICQPTGIPASWTKCHSDTGN